jgi:pimeloyl-ACP methyl ester carboxylesterase
VSLYVAEQRPDAGESVLFLHSGNVAGWMWTDQAEALPGHHALVPDLPGFGGSAHVPWADLATTADQVAAVVRERAHGGRAHVVGLSLGGIVGVALAARHPELVRSVFASGAILRGLDAPVLAIVGEKEPRTFRDALSEVTSRAPRAEARLVPGMHHVWSVEDPELFHDTLAHWLTTGEPSPALLPVGSPDRGAPAAR